MISYCVTRPAIPTGNVIAASVCVKTNANKNSFHETIKQNTAVAASPEVFAREDRARPGGLSDYLAARAEERVKVVRAVDRDRIERGVSERRDLVGGDHRGRRIRRRGAGDRVIVGQRRVMSRIITTAGPLGWRRLMETDERIGWGIGRPLFFVSQRNGARAVGFRRDFRSRETVELREALVGADEKDAQVVRRAVEGVAGKGVRDRAVSGV